jgi:hypothetical protein
MLVFFVFGAIRSSPGHICSRYYVQQNAVAQRIAGTPMVDTGLPSGSVASEGNTLTYRESFALRGPRATLAIDAEGTRTPFESNLKVRMTSGSTTVMVYSGPFDCPALSPAHAQGSK